MKNIVKSLYIILILLVFIVYNSFAQISFNNFDLNSNGDLLFSVKSETSDGKVFDSIFLKKHNSAEFNQLTFFPETIESFQNGTKLQIMNRFGLLNVDTTNGTVTKDKVFSIFDLKSKSESVMMLSMQTSPNLRWVTFVEAKSSVFGKLILCDTELNKQFILSEKVPLNSKPIRWAPDSSAFIYEVNSVLYFARPSWLVENKHEPLCKLGDGTISSIKWLNSGDFLFVSGSGIYKINSTEIFTRVLYNPLVSLGEPIGNLPFSFNCADDLFISETGKSIVFVRNKRHVYFFQNDSSKLSTENNTIPYLLCPVTTACVDVFWKNEVPIICTSGIESGKKVFQTWIVENNFKKLEGVKSAAVLSANKTGKLLALQTKKGLEIYDLELKKNLIALETKSIVSSCWGDTDTFFFGTDSAVFKVNVKTNSIQTIIVSKVENFSWDKKGETALATVLHPNGVKTLKYMGSNKWALATEETLQPKNKTNANYRVYTDAGFGAFKNMIFIRSLKENGTVSLIPNNAGIYATGKKKPSINYYSKQNYSKPQKGVFSHGSRAKRKIAIVFDVMQNTDGLAQVLYILNKYNIKATFFINGEAINSTPELIREIPSAGHQCGSMFFSAWNFSDSRYRIDGNFIRAGLARNEDSFYNATGEDLSLIWHSPYYIFSPMVLEAGRWAGYTFIVPDIQVPDWVTVENHNSLPELYKSSLEIIVDIIETVKNGSIVPINIGKTKTPRTDYLYTSIELLIIALLEEGYEITTVGNLMQNK